MKQASTLYRLGFARRALIAASCIGVVWLVTVLVISS
jgi:hypothetical protein